MVYEGLQLLFSISSSLVNCSCQVTYHVSPVRDAQCMQLGEPCVTISELASSSTFDCETTLSFLPGNHDLISDLVVTNVYEINIISVGNVNIVCKALVKIEFVNIANIHIHNVNFFGCLSTRVQSVLQLTILECSFNSGSTVELKNTSGNITRTSFVSNRIGIYKKSVQSLSQDSGMVGGALVVTTSDVLISSSTFRENSAEVGGAIYCEKFSNVTIITSVFIGNNVSCIGSVRGCTGGVLCAESGTNLTIVNSDFHSNTAVGRYSRGGVIVAFESTVAIRCSKFTANRAEDSGGIIFSEQSTLISIASEFVDSHTDGFGGVMYLIGSNIAVLGSTFVRDTAKSRGGVIYSMESSIEINGTTCTHNYAHQEGGAICMVSSTEYIQIYDSHFDYNSAGYGGVFSLRGTNAVLDIVNSTFNNNTAYQEGGTVYIEHCSLNIIHSSFTHNVAFRHGGVVYASGTSLVIQDSQFTHSEAKQTGSVVYAIASTVKTNGSLIISDNVARLGCVYFLQSVAVLTDQLQFSRNLGSMIIHNSVMNLTGYASFTYSSSVRQYLPTMWSEGGAITSFQSEITFNATCVLAHNLASVGGAIYAIESKLYVYQKALLISSNSVERNGGGIFLYLSELNLEFNGVLNISNNIASNKGGGVHAISSVIKSHITCDECQEFLKPSMYTGTQVHLIGNRAELGGGACLDANSKFYTLKKIPSLQANPTLTFRANSAKYGGALYISDETNSGVCASASYQSTSFVTECFIQSMAQYSFAAQFYINVVNMELVNNSANTSGADLYGGLLDRCTVSPFAEVYNVRDDFNKPYENPSIISGVEYFKRLSNTNSLDSVSSDSTKICFCVNDIPTCDYKLPPILVMKGEIFTIRLVAVDQVNHSLANVNIKASLASPQSGIGEAQLIQTTHSNKSCTDLYFNVYSPYNYEELKLHPEGPCKDATLSLQAVTINFLPCECLIGLQPNLKEASNCVCECDSRLQNYISGCHSTGILLREGTFWISFFNDTSNLNSSVNGFLIHPYCPFDYCKTAGSVTEINLNTVDGADAQCAYNRTSVLCGRCKQGLSLSLGSSRCIDCTSVWPTTLALTLVGSVIAGILLVVVLLVLKLTVAVGTLNGILFYVNILAAFRSTFFPNSEANTITVFIAWLNLEVGFDICFFKGMDAYHKTWLQVAFPFYIILLVIAIIVISEYWTKFARLIGRRDPAAVLATLVLVSYTKLLELIIAALSYAILKYPDSSKRVVWLPDASVDYLHGKHIALFAAALIILLIGVAYTAALFAWQWLLYYQHRKIIRWITINQKVSLFMEPYHAPYSFKHRYWTGLLLFVRVILYTISAVNTSSDPGINLLAVGITMSLVLIVRSCLHGRIYKSRLVEVIELICFLNITLLCFTTFFVLKSSSHNQTVVAYVSGSTTVVLFLVVIVYHVVFEVCLKIRARYGNGLNCCRRTERSSHSQHQLSEEGEALIDLNHKSEVECSVSFVDAPPRGEKPLSSVLQH